MPSERLYLDVIWARHEDGWGIPDDHPQFVAAFPSSLAEALPDIYEGWVELACARYGDEVDAPVVAFYRAPATIERPRNFDALQNLAPDSARGKDQ